MRQGRNLGQRHLELRLLGGFVNPALAGYQDVAGGSFLTGSPYLRVSYPKGYSTDCTAVYRADDCLALPRNILGLVGMVLVLWQGRQGRLKRAASRAIGDIATQIAAQDYARERAFQEQARSGLAGLGAQDIQTRITGATGLESAAQAAAQRRLSAAGGVAGTEQVARQQQLAAAGMAPQFYSQQFLPSQQLGQIGAAREQIAAQPSTRGNGTIPVWATSSLSAIAGLLIICLRYASRLLSVPEHPTGPN